MARRASQVRQQSQSARMVARPELRAVGFQDAVSFEAQDSLDQGRTDILNNQDGFGAPADFSTGLGGAWHRGFLTHGEYI